MAEAKPTLLIIDGDVIAFIAAAAAQKVVFDMAGNATQRGDIQEGKLICSSLIARFRNQLMSHSKDDTMLVILSDPEANWRFDVARDYKAVRNYDPLKRPMLLAPLKEFLRQEYGAVATERCEADDTISLLMTDPAMEDFHRIAVGRDKDFKSIPGWHYQLPKSTSDMPDKLEPYYITEAEADRWHMVQSLCGDMTDGIPGCPGIGKVRAERIIDECALLVPSGGVITRGPNKGKKTTKWDKVPAETVWDCIVSNYEKAGQGEAEALTTARLVRLLRYGEYNQGEVKLWVPAGTANEPPTSLPPSTASQ